ncbi:MAG TPA: enoyl-CoA hydratase/isomerase family protein [Pseudomonadales bacterium]|nr:enoyl-CoA hydratase/isomerase family protein [Pseudomonadales bacterium]
MTSYTTLLFDISDNIAHITLNRVESANSMNMDMGRELLHVTTRCEQDDSIRAVILTGAGQFFSAGGDLKAFSGFGDAISERLQELTDYLHASISALTRMRAPVVVAVNGAAVGAGFSLAMAGDVVLAADTAKFAMAYTSAGLSPDGGASYFLPRLVGLRRAQELIIGNRKLSAAEALDWGLITRVCPADQLMHEAQAMAKQLANSATQAIGTVKQQLLVSFDNTPEAQMALEGKAIAQLAASHDGQEGIQAFLGKRRPMFTGK